MVQVLSLILAGGNETSARARGGFGRLSTIPGDS